MALHAGFAAALSFTKAMVQGFIHAAYVNDLIAGRIQGSTSKWDGVLIAYDFSMAEPKIELVDGEFVPIHLDLLGSLTFSATDKPTLVTQMRLKISLLGAVIAVKKGAAYQFAIDASTVAITSFTPTVLSGDDPGPDYGFSPVGTGTATVIVQAVASAVPHFLLTPPQLAHFAQIGYKLAVAVRISPNSLNVGVDIKNLTGGDKAKLVDLNRAESAKGWKKTLHESAYTGTDDEYGTPIYETQWGPTKHRTSGKHNTAAAVSLHEIAFQHMYTRLGRFRIFAAFEEVKFAAAQKRYASLAGAFPKSKYEPNALALTALDQLTISFKHDYLSIAGVGSNYEVLAVHASFSLKLRIVRTFFDGSTSFIMGYSDADGITGERYDVVVTEPGWVSGMVVLGLFTGVMLLPHAGAVGLAVSAIAEMLIGSVVGTALGEWQDDLIPHALESMSGFHTALTYRLPGTDGPTFEVKCDDVLVRDTALNAWFDVESKAVSARIYLTANPSGTGTSSPEHAHWSATNLDPITVRFTSGGYLYNPNDTRVRIQWRVWAETKSGAPLINQNTKLTSSSRQITIDHAADSWMQIKKFVVTCRVYRPWDDSTDELFKQELQIEILDKLDRSHPYVHWNHVVHYMGYSAKLGDSDREPTGWVTESRKSHIHYTDPKLRCRFAAGFPIGLEPAYLDELAFPLATADQHRDEVCGYCFFGGPDKHVLKS